MARLGDALKTNEKKILMLVDFVIKFNLLAIPMYLIILSGVSMEPLQELTSDIVYAALSAGGYEIDKQGAILTLSESVLGPIIIDMDCTAWKSMYALSALILASPVANNRRKLKSILAGVLAIFLLNIVRIVSTIAILDRVGIEFTELVHTLLWREMMIFAVVAVWFFWIKHQKIISAESQSILKKVYN